MLQENTVIDRNALLVVLDCGMSEQCRRQADILCKNKKNCCVCDKNELAEELKAFLKEGDAALFKASRGMKLEDVIYSVYESLDK